MGYTSPYLEVRKVSGGWSLFAPTPTSTDDLRIYANTNDTFGQIKIDGLGPIYLYPQAGNGVLISPGGIATLEITNDTANTQAKINSAIANHDLYLAVTGTGVVKFGTHTGTGDVACNGYIAVKDAAGNARKLMTTA
jgi:hypothetical protein